MANYLDFLVVLDEHIANSSLGYIVYGYELYGLAAQAGLCPPGDHSPARWTGELVALGYATHGPLSLGDRRPLPNGPYSQDDVARVSDYRITYEGRTEADRVRRQRREQLTDAALGGVVPNLLQQAMSEPQRRAISMPLTHLRSALDSEQHAAAVGAAKDLVEAACKVAIERSGRRASPGATLPSLFKEALDATGAESAQAEVGRSLAAAVQRIGELRNAAGAGHGRASQPDVSAPAARLAASAASAIALFILGPPT